MELSKRLKAVSDYVSDGSVLADVGTDHGYIPIYLVRQNRIQKAIALDVNKGPLERARSHIQIYGLEAKIETRLSNGVEQITPGECDCVVIAGMGGALTIRILEDGEGVFRSLREFVLQPQSEIAKVREFLCKNQYRIQEENMVYEDGKYYPVLLVVNQKPELYSDIEFLYGKKLLENRHPVLGQFLEKEKESKTQILGHLKKDQVHQKRRYDEIEKEIKEIEAILSIWKSENAHVL